jgi:putative PepSY-like beta-lactamase-inhibitor
MKKQLMVLCLSSLFTCALYAQKLKSKDVPVAVKSALEKKYPQATNVTWEKEKGNYEANWGGKSGEDNSVQYTPSGDFIEIVKAIPVNQLPKSVISYVKEHYKGAKITEAGKVTDAQGKLSYEAEVNKKDLVFDEKGNFVKAED